MHLDVQHNADFLLVQFKHACNLNQTNLEEFKFQVLGSVEPSQILILNFKNLEFIDSAGLTMLIYIRKKILEKKGNLILCNVSEPIEKLLQITRLHRFLEIYKSVEDAVKSSKKTSSDSLKVHPFGLRLHVKLATDFSIIKIKQPDSLITANSEHFKKKVLEYLSNRKAVILDFNRICNIDSKGIAALIHLKKFARKNNKKIILVYRDRIITRLFKLYSIEDLFPQFPNTKQAVQSLKQNVEFKKPKVKAPITVQKPKVTPSFIEEYEDILFLSAYKN